MGIPEAEAVVDLTLAATRASSPARAAGRVACRSVGADTAMAAWSWPGRGDAAGDSSIVAPSPVEAQSPAGAPTLTNISPNQGGPGATVPVTLTGTNFIVGATTVTVNSGGVSAANVVVTSATSLTADIVMTAAAVLGAHTITVTTSHGTSGSQTFTVIAAAPGAPALTSVSPSQGVQGATVAVTLTGTNFVVGATTVTSAAAV